MSVRRLLWLIPIVLVLAIAYTGWLAWRVEGSLAAAEDNATQLQHAIDADDASARDAAVAGLRRHAADASQRTAGAWWGALAHVPFVGDDAAGVRAMSRSLDTVAAGGVQPLSDSVDGLDSLTAKGRVDVAQVERLAQPVAEADRAFARADGDLSGLDSSGYVGVLRTKFDRYARLVHDTSVALSSADKAVQVVPQMIGGDGPRNYLLIFQNNAEIRATGGLPGSWSVIHAEDGKLKVTQQGSLREFPHVSRSVLPLTPAEKAIDGNQLGTFFSDANFTPDFPRAAQLWTAHFEQKFPGTHLDGVLSLDPVALSYLLKGTGPVTVDGRTITSDNAIEELLNRPYRELNPDQQDVLFAHAAKAIFDATTGHLASPLAAVRGLSRAATEGRFLVAAGDPEVRQALTGTRVEGALTGDDGKTPHVDIAINDATGTKMSYYLRYWADLNATSCQGGGQKVQASMTLNQKITPEAARQLPESVTGPGTFGTARGKQLVVVDIYGPYAGKFDSLSINGKSLTDSLSVTKLDGRPVIQVPIMLSSTKDVVINWTMSTGEGETSDLHLGMTPSVVPGDNNAVIHSAC